MCVCVCVCVWYRSMANKYVYTMWKGKQVQYLQVYLQFSLLKEEVHYLLTI